MNIYEKLLAIQSELKAPKSQYNSFGKYKYRNCEDILEAVKPLCKKYNALTYLTDTIELIGDRYYVTATATFVDVEKPEVQPISVKASAREEKDKKGMDGSQVTGASSSYARKYALNGLFDIDDTKDSDTTNTGDAPTEPPAAPKKPSTKGKPSGGISESFKKKINESITQYKKIAKVETKAVLHIVEQQLGFSVAEITTEQQASEVIKLLLRLIAEYKEGSPVE